MLARFAAKLSANGTEMGIRFHCPNGHKLNVKSFLAGKRGICPHCGVKVDIPADAADEEKSAKDEGAPTEAPSPTPTPRPTPTSAPETAQPVAAAPVTASPVTASPVTASPVAVTPVAASPASPTVVPATPAPVAPADPLSEAPNAVWYVRPPSGGQFGPASAEIMRRWIVEGRVNEESLVWREGWPDWKPASGLLPGLSTSNAASPPGGAAIVSPRGTSSTMGAMQARRKNSNSMTVIIVVVLVLLCLFLAIFLGWVATRGGGEESTSRYSPSTTSNVVAVAAEIPTTIKSYVT